MTVYIDSNTFAANPALYADAEKTKPLPRVLPAVQLREGKLNVAFLGDRAPTTDMVLSLSAVLAGTQTQILAEYGDAVAGADVPTWEFPFALNSQALADVLADKQRASLLVGVIATAEGYRREWQILVTCDPTATGELDPEQVESVKTFADAAKRSADAAEESAENAAQSATNAAESATASAQSASASATSASNSATSASNAKASEDNAATSATNAAQSASDAAQSKTAAANSASAAATSASNASSSASAANTSAGNAANSASAASTSANNASDSASAAKTSETNAKASETAAKASETAAANSASSASTSATNAANSASSASTSATNAGNSAVAAAESAEGAASTLDTFRGEKATLETNIATNTANIDWLMTAIDGDWKTYMLARARMTGIQKNIDTVNRAIKEYNTDNTAALPVRMIEDWQNLYIDYETQCVNFGVESQLDVAFWVEYFVALAKWEADSTTTTWVTTKNADGTYASTSPFFEVAPTKPVINFNVTSVNGNNNLPGCFHVNTNVLIYLPQCTRFSSPFRSENNAQTKHVLVPDAATFSYTYRGCRSLVDGFVFAPTANIADRTLVSCPGLVNVSIYAPVATRMEGTFEWERTYTPNIKTVRIYAPSLINGEGLRLMDSRAVKQIIFVDGLPSATSVNNILNPRSGTATVAPVISFGDEWEGDISFPKAKTAIRFSANRTGFNQAVLFPVLEDGTDAFLNAGLDSANIATTLDSLPTRTAESGGTGVIAFTGCPGQIATQRFELFTVTDDAGVEYTLENCPTFDTDDENETLRKAFVLAQQKKGWTVEISEPVAQWYNYMLEKAALTGDAVTTNTETVERAKTELDTSGTSALAMRLYEDWLNLTDAQAYSDYTLGSDFWVEYFKAVAVWEADPRQRRRSGEQR